MFRAVFGPAPRGEHGFVVVAGQAPDKGSFTVNGALESQAKVFTGPLNVPILVELGPVDVVVIVVQDLQEHLVLTQEDALDRALSLVAIRQQDLPGARGWLDDYSALNVVHA